MHPTLLPISALQHLLYCERQCALIHIERVWAENQFTAEGQVLHQRAHEGSDESRGRVRITRTLPVRSTRLGISGQCDIVEFHADGTVLPVEYKRGKPKVHRADEVQLCAQAMCLEESLQTSIVKGAIFYGKTRRRTEVVFDETLRALTCEAAARLQNLLGGTALPPAVYEKKKCSACSLREICQPKTVRRVRQWMIAHLQAALE